ncbi:MAG: DUF4349 domain-containing protein [Paludibacteraceae bacterium]|nr:DUF4349 domain-containing protein [Paludibacteraceae bacterium]
MKKTLIFAYFLLTVCACSGSKHSEAAIEAVADVEETAAFDGGNTKTISPTVMVEDRKMVAKGIIDIDVTQKNVDSVYTNIDQLIKHYNGYKSKEEQLTWRHSVVANIPSGTFYNFTDDLAKVGGKLSKKDISVIDMTDKYNDVASSIKSKEAALNQYRELLKKANKMSDILEVQEKINELQEEMDRLNGSRLVIEKKAAYSEVTIDLNIENSNAPANNGPSFGSEIVEALAGGLSVIRYIFLGLLYIWPLLLIGGAGFYFYKKRKK